MLDPLVGVVLLKTTWDFIFGVAAFGAQVLDHKAIACREVQSHCVLTLDVD